MKSKDREDIRNILQEIKNNSVLIGGGSGEGERREMRNAELVWDLGIKLKEALDNSGIPEEKRKEEIRKIKRNIDSEILGRGNEWSESAYDWLIHFKDKTYYMFIARLAGYRENKEQNRFTKRRVRYLRTIYTKLYEPTMPKAKREKLTKLLQDDNTLSLNDHDYYAIIRDVRGQETIHWSEIKSSQEELSSLVEEAMADESEIKRKTLRETLGELLITQIRYALQLCVLDNKNDFEYAYERAKTEFKKKSKTSDTRFQQFFENLKTLVKNFEEKNKRIKKSDYYELEKLNSNLDAISSEKIYHEYTDRKRALGEVFS